MSEVAPENIRYMCCFCGKEATPTVGLEVIWNWAGTEPDDWVGQMFFCHASCFIDRLHERAQGDYAFNANPGE